VQVEHDRIPDDSPQPWVQVTTFQGEPEEIERTLRLLVTQVRPHMRDRPGWQGVLYLRSPDRRRCLTLSFWQSEAALLAGNAEAARLLSEVATGSVPIATVDQLQVAFRDVPADAVE